MEKHINEYNDKLQEIQTSMQTFVHISSEENINKTLDDGAEYLIAMNIDLLIKELTELGNKLEIISEEYHKSNN